MNAPIHLAVGAGTGQPTRTDFLGEAHQDRLRPGHDLGIPNQTVPHTRQKPKGEERRRDGWKRQDAAVKRSHHQQDRGVDWEDFSGQRNGGAGSNYGAVHIDQPKPNPVGKDLGTVREPENWAMQAAMTEEFFRVHGEEVGIDASLKLPGEGGGDRPGGPTGRGRRNRRRSYTLG